MPHLAAILTDYINAAFPGLWIQTWEPDEAQREIAILCTNKAWQLSIWDCAAGEHTTGQAAGDPIMPLKNITNLPEQTTILVLHNYHRFLTSPIVIQQLANVLYEGKAIHNHIIILSPSTQLPPELEKLFIIIEHELPSAEDLHTIATDLTTNIPNTNNPTHTISETAAGLTRYEAEAAFALSIARHQEIKPNVIWDLKAQILQKSGLLTLHRGKETFNQLAGLAAIKSFCTKALSLKQTQTRPKGVLLLGIPGTGKSMFAKALGNQTQRPTITLDPGSLMGSLVGQTEHNIRQALKITDAMQPCILFIDEIEKAFSGLGSSGDSGVATRLFATFLTWLSDHESKVFVIATSNDISKLPPEFTRAERWDAVFFLDLPDKTSRLNIWKIYEKLYQIPNAIKPPDEGWTGAEIQSCCRLASLLNISLCEAASYVIPIATTAAENVSALKEWSSGRCIDADTGKIYRSLKQTNNVRRRLQ